MVVKVINVFDNTNAAVVAVSVNDDGDDDDNNNNYNKLYNQGVTAIIR